MSHTQYNLTQLAEAMMAHSPSGRIKAALIDMDGTLYDSMPNHARAWTRLMHEAGIECTDREFFMLEGSTGANTIDLMIRRQWGRPATDAEKRDMYALKAKYFVELPPVGPMPGAREMVDSLIARGITTVLVTGSGQNSLLSRLDRDFPGAFPADRRVTSASVTHGKPHPEPFLKGLELAGVSAGHAIGIDNAPLGVASAHAAGITTVGVVTGPVPCEALRDKGADVVFNSMCDCAKILPELLDIMETLKKRTL
ncbi:MAG: HAD family phosphatase [Bacteroidales bacterium]|nr:HAD family phosphatase [Bacteroidales bacterium]